MIGCKLQVSHCYAICMHCKFPFLVIFLQEREYFKKAAENDDPNGHGNYNLGVLYLKGLGVKKDTKIASRYFIIAANAGQPKAFYQLAKMFQKGIGLKKDLMMVGHSYFVFLYIVLRLGTSLFLHCLHGVSTSFLGSLTKFCYLYFQMIRFI